MRPVRFTSARRRSLSRRKSALDRSRARPGPRLGCESLEDRLLLAATLPIYATFDQNVRVYGPPDTGGLNEPSAVVTPANGRVWTEATYNGINSQPAIISDYGSANYGSIDFDFAPITTGSVRMDATVAFSRLVDGYFLQIGDGADIQARLHVTSSGQITDDAFRLLGNYQRNVPFRVRMTVSPAESTWSVVVDEELDGFQNNSPFSGNLYSLPQVSRFSASLCTTIGSAAANVAYDNVQISTLPDLIVSNVRPLYYDAGKLQYEYTVRNIGDSPADIEGPTGADTDNVTVEGILSADDDITTLADNVSVGTAVLHGDRSGQLEAGGTLTGTIDALASVAGANPYLFVRVDPGNVAPEQNETNNLKMVQIPSAGQLPVLSTFNYEQVGIPATAPRSTKLNEPTSVSPASPVTGGASVLTRAPGTGFTSQYAELADAGSAHNSFLAYNFAAVSDGLLRVEATISLSRLVDTAAILETQQTRPTLPNWPATRVYTTVGGLLETTTVNNTIIRIGTYSPNTPFRVRMDIDLTTIPPTWSFVQDKAMDGFDNDTVYSPLPLSTATVTQIDRVLATFTTAAGSPAASAGFDDIVITRPDLVISALRPVASTNDTVEYQYTVTNIGGAPTTVNAGKSEIQRLSFAAVPTSGSYTLTFDPDGSGRGFDPQTTAWLSYNANAAVVQSALQGLTRIGRGNLLVSGTYTAGFTITYIGVLGGQDISDTALTATTNATWQPIVAVPSVRTSATDQGGDADDVQIHSALSADSVYDSSVDPATRETFPNSLARATPTVLNPGESVTRLYRAWTANEEQQLNFTPVPDFGTYTLTFDPDGTGPTIPVTTPTLNFNASASQIQAALESLSTIGTGNISVSGSYTGGYTITYVRSLGHVLDTALTANAAALRQPVTAQFLPVNLQQQQLVFTPMPDAGTYTLAFDPDGTGPISPATTANLNFDATDSQIQVALESLSTIGTGNISVLGVYFGTFTRFTITYGPSLGSVLDTTLTANTSALSRSVAVQIAPVARVAYPNFALEATPSTRESDTTNNSAVAAVPSVGDIDLSGALCDVPAALIWGQTFPVQFQVHNSGTATLTADSDQRFALSTDQNFTNYRWLVGHVSLTESIPGGGTSSIVTAQLTLPDNEVQQLVFAPVPDLGRYTLTFDPDGPLGLVVAPRTTVNLAYNATAPQVQAVLQALSTIGTGNISVSGDYINGFRITFVGSLGHQDILDTALTASTATATSGGGPVAGKITTVVDGAPAGTGFTGPGPFYIGMWTDASDNVVETNETNNRFSVGPLKDYDTVSIVTGPDLQGLLLSLPSQLNGQLNWNQRFPVQYAVTEPNGIPVAGTLRQAFYLSKDTTFGNSDDLYLGSLTYTAGASMGTTQNGWLQMPSGEPAGYSGPGPFYIGMATDADNAVVESNEVNNAPVTLGTGPDNFSFRVVSVDLRGSLCDVVPSEISWGQPFDLRYQVRNEGTTPVTTSIQQAFYLSADQVFGNSDDVLIPGAIVTYTGGVPELGAGATRLSTIQLPATAPAGFDGAGPFYIGMVTDYGTAYGGAVGESNEINNAPMSYGLGADADSFSIASSLPDLQGAQCYPPVKIQWGRSFLVNYQVANNGRTAVTTDFYQAFVLSKDQVYGNSDDVILGGTLVTIGVAASGQTPLMAINLTLPASAPAGYSGTGPFYIGMITDAGGAVWESSESNNVPFSSALGRDWQFFYIGQPTPPPANAASSTLGLFDPAASMFYLRNENTTGTANYTFGYGQPGKGWKLLAGDWDGNGSTGVGLYDPTSSTFYLTNAYVSGNAKYTFGYGEPGQGWIPLVGDWNGDGHDGVGLYDPQHSTFYLTDSLESGYAQHTFGYGEAGGGWTPLVGDWNGDGKAGVGLYDSRTSTFYLSSALETGYAEHSFGYGQPDGGWKPLVGDWNGDRLDGVGLYAPNTSTFYLTNTFQTGFAEYTFGYGQPNANWQPLVGDWNGDGAAGVGLYAPSSSTFYLTDTLAGGYAEYTAGFGQPGAGMVPFVGRWQEQTPAAPAAAATPSATSPSVVNAAALDQIDLAAVAAHELAQSSTTDLSANKADSPLAIDLALANL